MNKEELTIQNAILQDEKVSLEIKDKEKRKEFAKAFDWYKEKEIIEQEVLTPSWEEIFVEIGKLLTAKNFMSFQQDLQRLESKLETPKNVDDLKI